MLDFEACPRCGSALEAGFIDPGARTPLRWDTGEPRATIFGGEKLVDFPLAAGSQRVSSQRCRTCHLVLFEANPDARTKWRNDR